MGIIEFSWSIFFRCPETMCSVGNFNAWQSALSDSFHFMRYASNRAGLLARNVQNNIIGNSERRRRRITVCWLKKKKNRSTAGSQWWNVGAHKCLSVWCVWSFSRWRWGMKSEFENPLKNSHRYASLCISFVGRQEEMQPWERMDGVSWTVPRW